MDLRILHVLGRMNRGGVETWLMHILRHIDRDRFAMDFLVHTTEPGAYDAEIRRLGSRIIPCLSPSRPWSYAAEFRRILREHGPYDVVHSHVHHFSGFVLRQAAKAGIPVRIAHSHLDSSCVDALARILRSAYLQLCGYWIDRYATVKLACSAQAGSSLFGRDWKEDPRVQVLPCAIDLTPFHDRVTRDEVRAELSISPHDFVMGHVGRFDAQKNHPQLLRVAAAVMRREPRAKLLLVGTGVIEGQIRSLAVELGIADRVIFAGQRGDVPRLMLGAMDVFVFPSLYEGLGLVVVEAQAAGLPCVISDVVPCEADMVPGTVRRLRLDDSPETWAGEVLSHHRGTATIAPADALRAVEQTSFAIREGINRLESCYEAWGQSRLHDCHVPKSRLTLQGSLSTREPGNSTDLTMSLTKSRKV